KGTVEKVLVQFGQGGQLELAPPAPGKPTEFRGQFATGVEDPQTCQRGFHPGPVELTAHDVDVEVHILPHHELGPFQGTVEGSEDFLQGRALLLGQSGGYAVDLFGLIGYVE